MKPRTAMGICLILASFGFYGAGGYIITTAVDVQDREDRKKLATDKQCVEIVEALPSVSVTHIGRQMTAIMRGVSDPRKALSDASFAALMCPGRSLSNVCLGDACKGSQNEVVLRFTLEGKD